MDLDLDHSRAECPSSSLMGRDSHEISKRPYVLSWLPMGFTGSTWNRNPVTISLTEWKEVSCSVHLF